MAITDQVQWTGLGASASATYGITTVTVVPTVLLVANIVRLSAIIQNQSNVDVFLGFDQNVTPANYFLRLRQYDAYEINATNMWVGYVFAVVAAGTADVSVLEEI